MTLPNTLRTLSVPLDAVRAYFLDEHGLVIAERSLVPPFTLCPATPPHDRCPLCHGRGLIEVAE